MVDPQTNSFLLLYDDAQAIYKNTQRRKFSFASVGIQAKGRTSIMRINYRNTAEVLALAYEFAKETISPCDADEDGIPVIAPESAGRHGNIPLIKHCRNLKAEIDYIIGCFRQYHDEGIAWKKMAIFYRTKFMGEEAAEKLRNAGIPSEWLQDDSGSRRFDPEENSVKVMTFHKGKGLEFPVVALPGVGYLPLRNYDLSEEARLLYVGMTRSIEHLLLTYHTESAFVQKLLLARKGCGMTSSAL